MGVFCGSAECVNACICTYLRTSVFRTAYAAQVHVLCIDFNAHISVSGGGAGEGSSGLLLRLLCIIPNKQLITRVLNQGELASSGS